MIELRAVSKEYTQGGRVTATLQGIDLHVARGQFVSVMGPSGAGKSTLLHLIAGLDVPTRGEIYVDGRCRSTTSDDETTRFRRRHLGIVFQGFNLLPTLTVEDNVALPLLLDGAASRAARLRASRLLERVGLLQRRSHRPDQLSGGEAQRVAIARALVIEPLVLLADEPTGSLDSVTGRQVLALLAEVQREADVTVLLVTHDATAAAHGSRVVHMADGQLVTPPMA